MTVRAEPFWRGPLCTLSARRHGEGTLRCTCVHRRHRRQVIPQQRFNFRSSFIITSYIIRRAFSHCTSLLPSRLCSYCSCHTPIPILSHSPCAVSSAVGPHLYDVLSWHQSPLLPLPFPFPRPRPLSLLLLLLFLPSPSCYYPPPCSASYVAAANSYSEPPSRPLPHPRPQRF